MPPKSSQRTKPPALQPGDTVGIVAPASPIQRNQLAAGCASLARLGYKPFYLDSIFDQELYFAGSVRRRARELEEIAHRLRARNVRVVCADGRALPADLTDFDRALVDAPCSGLGVLDGRPDLRWRSEPLPELQLELLLAAAARVKPGGTVVYSVCTINADESETVVDASGLEPEQLGAAWPQFAHPRRPEFLQTLPHIHRTSGFFVARLRVP